MFIVDDLITNYQVTLEFALVFTYTQFFVLIPDKKKIDNMTFQTFI